MPQATIHAPNITYTIDYSGNAPGGVDPYLEAIALGAVRAEQYRRGVADATDDFHQKTLEAQRLLGVNDYLNTITPENWDAKKDEAIPILQAEGLAIPEATTVYPMTWGIPDISLGGGFRQISGFGTGVGHSFATDAEAEDAMRSGVVKPYELVTSPAGVFVYVPMFDRDVPEGTEPRFGVNFAPARLLEYHPQTNSNVTPSVIEGWHRSLKEKATSVSQVTEKMATHLQLLIGQKELFIYLASDGNQTRGRTLHGVADNIK